MTDGYLCIDQGGHASRAFIFDRTGKVLAQHSEPIHTLRAQPNHVEHSASQLLDATRRAMQLASAALSQNINIVSAGLATQRSSIVCWDKTTGTPLSPIISWQDRRTAHSIKSLGDQADTIHASTGLVLSPHYGASKLAWCMMHNEHVNSALKRNTLAWGPLASYLTFQLTQQQYYQVDIVNAMRTLLANRHTLAWDERLCNLFAIPMPSLPTIKFNRADFGSIQINNRRIPLQLVTGDQPAALFSNGMPRKNHAYINIGTGAFIQYPSSSPNTNSPTLLHSPILVDEEQRIFSIEATVNGADSALHWAASLLGIPTQTWHAQISQWMEQFDLDLFFLNGIGGLGSPYWRADFGSIFSGEGSAQEKMCAVVESIVFLLVKNLHAIAQLGHSVDGIIISGGVSHINGLCQNLSNLTNLIVTKPSQIDATAKGLAFLLSNDNQNQHYTIDDDAARYLPTRDEKLLARYTAWLDLMEKHLQNG